MKWTKRKHQNNENGPKSPKMNGIIKNRDKPVVQNEANEPK